MDWREATDHSHDQKAQERQDHLNTEPARQVPSPPQGRLSLSSREGGSTVEARN